MLENALFILKLCIGWESIIKLLKNVLTLFNLFFEIVNMLILVGITAVIGIQWRLAEGYQQQL